MKIKFSFPDNVLSSMETQEYRDLVHTLNILLCSKSEIVGYTYAHDPREMAVLFDVETKSDFPTPQDALKAVLLLGYKELETYLVLE